ncbi:hypothetical protein [Ornithinimicrobium sp. INDO-MA30-4]|uniref:hypothetical protein n=1 Tax=Ornithinimicrobium sp. INDO-MA30-4 TaxID=2908651 RepID=UPI001F422965|nr:hypothetical protein [Ornithinimicrobium sp. INDO-MA30-4]UJH71706.1 hypothetical protein L0A91_15605 [Ornithinimicrobium sp. INDO-MA30-4]
MMYLANFYADRNAEGVYSGNSGQAIYAVNCLDRPSPEGAPTAEEMQPQFDEVAPVFGKYLNGEGACGIWPETAVETIDDYSAAGAPRSWSLAPPATRPRRMTGQSSWPTPSTPVSC